VVTRRRPGRSSRGISGIHCALKISGILALVCALYLDRQHATIYAAGIVALATSHKLVG